MFSSTLSLLFGMGRWEEMRVGVGIGVSGDWRCCERVDRCLANSCQCAIKAIPLLSLTIFFFTPGGLQQQDQESGGGGGPYPFGGNGALV